MLVNNNRVYSSKLACLLSPCPTLGSRWCNVTAQFQHLPSLSNTGGWCPEQAGPGQECCGMWYTGHWPASVSCGSGTQLHSSPSCGAASVASDEAGPAVPGAGASPDYCVLSLPSVCLPRHQTGMATSAALVMWFGSLKDTSSCILLLSLDWTVWTNTGVTGSPTYCPPHQSAGGMFKSRGSRLLHRAVPCCSWGSNSLVHSLLLFPRTPAG